MSRLLKNAMILALLLASVGVSAQRRFSVNFGYAPTIEKSITKVSGSADITNKAVFQGLTAGFAYDLMFTETVGLDMGLNYTFLYKRDKTGTGDNNFSGLQTTHNFHNLDIAARFLFSFPATDNIRIFAYAGPKFSFDVAGSIKTQLYFNGEEVGGAYSQNFYDKDQTISRFNLLIGPGVGVKLYGFVVKVGHDFGILNLNTNKETKKTTTLLRSNSYISLGFAF